MVGKRNIAFILLICALLSPRLSLAQASSSQGETEQKPADIEELFSNDDPLNEKSGDNTSQPPPVAPPAAVAPNTNGPAVKNLSDLTSLAPFSDIAIIQKRFLPKTGRFEFFSGAAGILNDPFFINTGVNLRLGYNFREKWGVEASGLLLTTIKRQATTGLAGENITTTSLVTPTSYIGVDLKWSPIYGKITWLNHKITPFDMYFSVGLGSTGTNQGSSAGTLHLGTGQIFALTKAWAFRWDVTWNSYSTTSSVNPQAGSSTYNNVFLILGASYFFPEATYR